MTERKGAVPMAEARAERRREVEMSKSSTEGVQPRQRRAMNDQGLVAVYGRRAADGTFHEETAEEADRRHARDFRPSRADRRSLTSFQTNESVVQLKILAVKEKTTVQALLAEGMNKVFLERGLPPIAEP